MMCIFRYAEVTVCRMCLKSKILLPCPKFNSRIFKRIDTFPRTNQQSIGFSILGIPLNTQDISNIKCKTQKKKNGLHMAQVNPLKNNVQYYQDLNQTFSTTSVYNRSSDTPNTPDHDSSKDIKDIVCLCKMLYSIYRDLYISENFHNIMNKT